jgi:bifunctional non-homologous end joining protein LigD
MITPMVARPVRDPFDRAGWLFELKWDGFRAIAETDGARKVKLYSRRQNDFAKRFPPIADVLAELDERAVILDGEIVALNEHGHPGFEWLVNRGQQKGTLVYYIFDLLMLGSEDLRALPLLKRKAQLARLLKNQRRLIYVEGQGVAMFAGALALGLEGVVGKGCEESVRGRSPRDLALAEDQEPELQAAREGGVWAIPTALSLLQDLLRSL